jgi:endoglucanase
MKKITFLIILFVSSLGFSQNLLTNGDFETGDSAPWTGNSTNGTNLNVIDDGTGNFVNESIITTAAEGWRVSLQQAQSLVQGESYEFSFVASADADRVITLGIGKNGGDFAGNNANPTITTVPTAYSFILEANFDTVTDGSRAFFDLGDVVSTVILDDISLVLVATTCNNGMQDGDETGVDCGGPTCGECPNPPATAAPLPPNRDPAEVFGVYTDAYDTESSSIAAFGGGSIDDFMVGGDNFLQLSGSPGANVQWEFGIPNGVDLSGFTHYHMDYYFEGDVPDPGAVFQTIIQGFDSGSNFTGNTLHNVTPTVTGQWLSLDIPISTFNGGVSVRDNIGQMQLAMAGPAFGPTYIDNVYFHNNTVLSTEDFETASFKAFPNPTNGDWNISGNAVINTVTVFDILGKQVLALEPNSNDFAVNASSLRTGVYFARIEGANGSQTIKLVKQ